MSQPNKAGLVLVFGESKNDSGSIRYLAAANNRSLELRRIIALPRPTSLQRTAKTTAVRRWVDQIAATVTGFEASGKAVAAVLVHRDADMPDPDGQQHRRLTKQLLTVRGSHAVVPVEELEAWWFLFPEAIESVRPQAWENALPCRARDVETIRKPKRELMRITAASRAARYAENDSITIARRVFDDDLSPLGHSRSYDRFCTAVREIA